MAVKQIVGNDTHAVTEAGVKKVKITFPRLRGEKDQTIFVGVNDENYLIKRGEEVEVPVYVAEVIRNSEAAMDEADAFNARVSTDN